MTSTDWKQNDWIQTHTGKRIFPLRLQPEDIDIRDIAHALSLQCRYAGHIPEHYSVAQHCLFCYDWAQIRPGSLWTNAQFDTLLLAILLHDASEAYLTDIPRPLKVQDIFSGYRDLESHVQRMIFDRFGLNESWYYSSTIKAIDNEILVWESQELRAGEDWCEVYGCRPADLSTLWIDRPEVVEAMYLQRVENLTEKLSRKA